VTGEVIEVSKYCVSAGGMFDKWHYKAVAYGGSGAFGLGFGVSREAAIHRALRDLEKDGGRRDPCGAFSHDDQGRLCVSTVSGIRYVLAGERWVRAGK
jgi:hypothetical protein